jgi:acylphosphatase
MSLCIKIKFSVEAGTDAVRVFLQKQAQAYALEGTAQFAGENSVQMVVCGEREQVDSFIDELHVKSTKFKIGHIELEPFLKTKDYRKSFRVID